MKRFGEVIEPIYHKICDICSINDDDNAFKKHQTFCISNRIFASEKNNQIKFTVDLHKTKVNARIHSLPELEEWPSFDMSFILGHESICSDLSFFKKDMLVFLDAERRMTVIKAPYLENVQVNKTSVALKQDLVRTMPDIKAFLFKENIQVQFYKCNPIHELILIVSGAKIIIWNVKYQKNNFLVIEIPLYDGIRIFDAEWCPNGEFFTITLNNGLTIVFNKKLEAVGLIEEEKNHKVMILETQKSRSLSNCMNHYLFSCGVYKLKDKFVFGIKSLTVTPVIYLIYLFVLNLILRKLTFNFKKGTTVKRLKKYNSLDDSRFSSKSDDKIFTFYDDINTMLYLGKRGHDKIFCLNYCKTTHSISCNYSIPVDGAIDRICLLPLEKLDACQNQIAK